MTDKFQVIWMWVGILLFTGFVIFYGAWFSHPGNYEISPDRYLEVREWHLECGVIVHLVSVYLL